MNSKNDTNQIRNPSSFTNKEFFLNTNINDKFNEINPQYNYNIKDLSPIMFFKQTDNFHLNNLNTDITHSPFQNFRLQEDSKELNQHNRILLNNKRNLNFDSPSNIFNGNIFNQIDKISYFNNENTENNNKIKNILDIFANKISEFDNNNEVNGVEECDVKDLLNQQNVIDNIKDEKERKKKDKKSTFHPSKLIFYSKRESINENIVDNQDVKPEKPLNPCSCKQAKCIKLYCECFANGKYCIGCSCVNCFNLPEYDDIRNKAKVYLKRRNKSAFKPKIVSDEAKSKDKHLKGCKCKNSNCLKNYCECFQIGVGCSDSCRCKDCKNNEKIDKSKSLKREKNKLEFLNRKIVN